MKDIVIDSNILFSALRSGNSRTRAKILTSSNHYFSPNFIIVEIFNHKERIIKDSKKRESDTLKYLSHLLDRIHFVNERNISIRNFILAYELCKNIDEEDTPFVALAIEMNCQFWTRDKLLKAELQRKGFTNLYDETND